MTSSPALRNLFHPVDPTEIAQAVAEDRRLFRKTDQAAAFARFLPWETLNSLINADGLTSGRVSMARQGRALPLEMAGLARRPKGGDWVAAEAIHNLCHQGLSLVLNGVDKQVRAIAAMNAMVERFLRCDTITNAYASFNRDSAFKPHLDPHNVLILQIHGRKRWWCYGQVAHFPVDAQVFPDAESLPPPEWEGVLEPGDILFVPRGDVHRAMVEDMNSLHLTVTMTPPTGADLFAWLSRQDSDRELGRRYLPIHGPAEALQGHREALAARFHGLVDALDIDGFLLEMDQARPPVRPFNLGLEQSLGPATEVQPALRRRLALPEARGADIRVVIGGATVTLSAAERDVLMVLLDADALTVEQLGTALPTLDVYEAVSGLARKALIFLFAPH